MPFVTDNLASVGDSSHICRQLWAERAALHYQQWVCGAKFEQS